MLFVAILLLVFWTILCVGVERFVPGTTEVDHDIKNRFVSMFHGLASLILSASYLWRTGMHFCDESTYEERLIVLFSVTYFVYDFAACLYFGIWDKSLVLHHFCSIFGFMVAFLSTYGAKCSIYGLFIAETSNFPMHLRVILRTKGKRHTKLYEVMESIYLIFYIVFRGLLAPFNVYACLSCPKTPVIVTSMCIFLTLQSWHFISKMFGIIKKKGREMQERKSKGLSLWWLEVNPALSSLTYFNKNTNQGIF